MNISESNAIAFYLANEQLRGKSLEDQAFVQQWISFADNEILPPACTWVFPCMGIMPFNKQATERAQADLKAALAALNDHLKLKTFLVGERISLADICCMANLLMPYKWVLDPEFRAGFNNVTRWFLTMVNQPQVKKVLGEVALCTKMAAFDAKKFAEFSGKGAGKGAGGKKEGKAEKAPKQEKTPKEKTPAVRRRAKRKRHPSKRKPPRRRRRRRRRSPRRRRRHRWTTSRPSPRRKIPSPPSPSPPSSSTSSSGSIPTRTSRPKPSLTSGKISTRKISPSGSASISSPKISVLPSKSRT